MPAFPAGCAASAGCRSLANLAPWILRRDFEPGFFVDHFVKDLGIALEEARRMGLTLPGLSLANELYQAVQARGLGSKGTQALMLALEALSSGGGLRAATDGPAGDAPVPTGPGR